MSLIATNPFALCRYAPSLAMLQNRQPSCCFGTNALLARGRRANTYERTDGRLDQPRRIVVAVAASRAVDEHCVLGADLALPVRQAQLVREGAQPCATLLLHRRGHGVVGLGDGAGTRRV